MKKPCLNVFHCAFRKLPFMKMTSRTEFIPGGDTGPDVHRMIRRVPEWHLRYGLFIIDGSEAVVGGPDGFADCSPRRFEYYSISHLYAGGGRYWSPECGEAALKPGTLVVVTPGKLNRYGGAEGRSYCEDSVRFRGDIADRMRDCGIIADGFFEFGTARRLLPVIEAARDPAIDSQLRANLLLQRLMVECYLERRRPARPGLERLLARLREDWAHWWTVTEMAEICGMSPDRLRRAFLRETGMLPKHYLESLKLNRAAELLRRREMTVQQIAASLGYADSYHFSRRFKKFAGAAPEHYRNPARTSR